MCNVVFSSPWPMGMETFAITWHPSTMIHRKSFTFKSYPPKPLNQVKSSLDGVVLWWILFRIVSDSHSPFKMAAVTKNNMFLTVYCCLIWQWVIQHFFLWNFCEICLSDDLYQLCKFNLKKKPTLKSSHWLVHFQNYVWCPHTCQRWLPLVKEEISLNNYKKKEKKIIFEVWYMLWLLLSFIGQIQNQMSDYRLLGASSFMVQRLIIFPYLSVKI